MKNLREKGRLPASSDSSSGALPIPRLRAQRNANLRTKGRIPASSDSSPGALPVEGPGAPSRIAMSLRPRNALPPAPEPIRLDEDECKEREVAPAGAGAETGSNIYSIGTVEACAYTVQDQEDLREPVCITVYQPPPAAEEAKKWHDRFSEHVWSETACLS